MKLLAIFVLCVLANATRGLLETDRKCGEKLTQIMWVVCDKNNFNSLLDKRSAQPALALNAPYPYASSSLDNIFQIDAGNLLTKTRRMRMLGIADECCRKSCTLNELSAYCI